MKYQKDYDELIKLNPAEEVLKEYYQKNQEFYPVEKLPLILPDFDYIQWGINKERVRRSSEILHSWNPPELSEEDFFQKDNDIKILKNIRYSRSADHQHAFFEILYLINGECTNIVDGCINTMEAGDLCIITPRVLHSIEVVTDSVVLNILIRASTFTETFVPLLRHSNILSDFFNEILYSNNYKKYLMFHTGDDEIILDSILELYKEQQEMEPYYHNIMNGLLIAFWGKLLQRHEKDVEYPEIYVEKYNIIPKIEMYIKKNCSSVTLQSCAEHFHFNSQYLSTLLKKHTGKTFSAVLTDTRMVYASELLVKSDISVKETGMLAGYQEPAYFMKVFKKYFGVTPSEYRSRYKQ